MDAESTFQAVAALCLCYSIEQPEWSRVSGLAAAVLATVHDMEWSLNNADTIVAKGEVISFSELCPESIMTNIEGATSFECLRKWEWADDLAYFNQSVLWSLFVRPLLGRSEHLLGQGTTLP